MATRQRFTTNRQESNLARPATFERLIRAPSGRMAGMTAYTPFRKRKRILMFLAGVVYLCVVVRVTKDLRSLVVFVGVGILFLIFFSPSARGPATENAEPKEHKKTKKRTKSN
jgi:fucose permease